MYLHLRSPFRSNASANVHLKAVFRNLIIRFPGWALNAHFTLCLKYFWLQRKKIKTIVAQKSWWKYGKQNWIRKCALMWSSCVWELVCLICGKWKAKEPLQRSRHCVLRDSWNGPFMMSNWTSKFIDFSLCFCREFLLFCSLGLMIPSCVTFNLCASSLLNGGDWSYLSE